MHNVQQIFECGGTLIDIYTVLTAAHCILTTFDIIISGRTYTIDVANPFDPTQYTVYVALNSISFMNTGSIPSAPAVAMDVQKVIRVRFLNKRFK